LKIRPARSGRPSFNIFPRLITVAVECVSATAVRATLTVLHHVSAVDVVALYPRSAGLVFVFSDVSDVFSAVRMSARSTPMVDKNLRTSLFASFF
jgi:hypothetical protein